MSTESIATNPTYVQSSESSPSDSSVNERPPTDHGSTDSGAQATDDTSAPAPAKSNLLVEIVGFLLLAAITGVAFWYRFHQLELKPLHHDEGVNGWFIMRLLNEGKYAYNPKNYHGPLLYVLGTLPVLIGGNTDFWLRCMPALFGSLVVPAMALFRRQLGWLGVLVSAAYIAVAPIEVYFSRTAIHEIYNFVFNITLVGAVAAWAATRKPWLLTFALCSLVCLFGTKETTIITVAAVVPALLLAVLFGKGALPEPGMQVHQFGWTGRVLGSVWYLAACLMNEKENLRKSGLIALGLWAFLFTYFLNPLGLGSFFAAFFLWGDTGVEGKGHQKIWSYFLTHLLWPYYRPVLILGALGLIWGSLKQNRLAIFTLVWMVLATAAYSVIPYKTPWCVLSFSSPLFIGTGVLMKLSWDAIVKESVLFKLLGLVSILLSLALLPPYAVPMGPEYTALVKPPLANEQLTTERKVARFFLPWEDSITINFKEYDVKGHPFIYVQNVREYLDLVHDVDGLIQTAQLEGDTKKPTIVLIDAKNPMRWYLRKTGTQYWPKEFGDDAKKKVAAMPDVILVSKEQSAQVKVAMKDKDYEFRRYPERPGRKIDLYVKRSLWQAFQQAGQAGKVPPPSPAPKEKSYSDTRTAEMKEDWSRKAMN